MTLSWPHTTTPQSSAPITNYILTAPHFTCPEKMEAKVKLFCFGKYKPGHPARMSEHASERLMP